MAEKFVGTWKLVASDNFDEYLKALGVSFAKRQIMCKAKPSVTISLAADGTITLGKREFDETTGDDRNVVTLENGKMLQRQRWEGKETTIERELVGDKLIMKLKIGDVVATRTFEKA